MFNDHVHQSFLEEAEKDDVVLAFGMVWGFVLILTFFAYMSI